MEYELTGIKKIVVIVVNACEEAHTTCMSLWLFRALACKLYVPKHDSG